jgi:hypothetical protein
LGISVRIVDWLCFFFVLILATGRQRGQGQTSGMTLKVNALPGDCLSGVLHITTTPALFAKVSVTFYNQENQRNHMIKQVKDIDWFGQRSVFQHQKFFNDMRHRAKWSKEHDDRNNDQDRVWYFVKKRPHVNPLDNGSIWWRFNRKEAYLLVGKALIYHQYGISFPIHADFRQNIRMKKLLWFSVQIKFIPRYVIEHVNGAILIQIILNREP